MSRQCNAQHTPSPSERRRTKAHVPIADVRQLSSERRRDERVVGDEERVAADLRDEMVEDGLDQESAIEGGSVMSQLMETSWIGCTSASAWPSYVDVPRPSSSRMTSDEEVAWRLKRRPGHISTTTVSDLTCTTDVHDVARLRDLDHEC